MDFVAACTGLNAGDGISHVVSIIDAKISNISHLQVTTVEIYAGDVKWAGPELHIFLMREI